MNFKNLSKHLKYTTNNPISNYLVHNFLQNVGVLYQSIKINSIIDVGCGEGLVLKYISDFFNNNNIVCNAIDLSQEEVKSAKRNIPFCNVKIGNAYNIPFDDNYAELVICTEVLEHLENPILAINEISRVTKKYALLTVPNEPLWRILNIIRLKYISNLGNTLGHLNHWSPKQFKLFIDPYFKVIDKKNPIPWTIYLCEKKY